MSNVSGISSNIDLPMDIAELMLAKKDANKVTAISINKDGKLVPNGNDDAEYKVTLRKIEKAKDGDFPEKSSFHREPSERTMKLKACKGLKGCEFADCVKQTFGKLPKHLEKLCLTKDQDIDA